jgi:hypothetical protein
MPEQPSNDAATLAVLDFADRHDLTEVQAREILSLADGDVHKADAFVEKARMKKARTAELRPPLSAEFT